MNAEIAATSVALRRGQVVLVELEREVGPERGTARPAVIISNDAANVAAFQNDWGVLTIIPLTSTTATIRPYHVLVPAHDSGLPRDSTARAEQIRAISSSRVVRSLAWLPSHLIAELDQAVRVHLSLA